MYFEMKDKDVFSSINVGLRWSFFFHSQAYSFLKTHVHMYVLIFIPCVFSSITMSGRGGVNIFLLYFTRSFETAPTPHLTVRFALSLCIHYVDFIVIVKSHCALNQDNKPCKYFKLAWSIIGIRSTKYVLRLATKLQSTNTIT